MKQFALPPKAAVGHLDPEIAGEGIRVIGSDGSALNWTPPPPAPVIPDLSRVKSVRHYFGRTGYQTWPAWLYHPKEPARIVKNAEEAYELGVVRREATPIETSRYGVKFVWDFEEDSDWRPEPFDKDKAFDPSKPGQGKTLIAGPANPIIAQNALIEALIPKIAEVMAASFRAPGAPAATPAPGVDPARWAKFVEFEAWEQSQKAVNALAGGPPTDAAAQDIAPPQSLSGELLKVAEALDPGEPEEGAPLPFEDEEAEFAAVKAEAVALGIKIDKRWGVGRIREEIKRISA